MRPHQPKAAAQAKAKPSLAALAWPDLFKSRSRLRPGQSHSFQAKLGWNITSEDDDMSSHVGDILNTDTDAVMEAVEDVHKKPCWWRCEDAMMDLDPIEISSNEEEETADDELCKVFNYIFQSVN